MGVLNDENRKRLRLPPNDFGEDIEVKPNNFAEFAYKPPQQCTEERMDNLKEIQPNEYRDFLRQTGGVHITEDEAKQLAGSNLCDFEDFQKMTLRRECERQNTQRIRPTRTGWKTSRPPVVERQDGAGQPTEESLKLQAALKFASSGPVKQDPGVTSSSSNAKNNNTGSAKTNAFQSFMASAGGGISSRNVDSGRFAAGNQGNQQAGGNGFQQRADFQNHSGGAVRGLGVSNSSAAIPTASGLRIHDYSRKPQTQAPFRDFRKTFGVSQAKVETGAPNSGNLNYDPPNRFASGDNYQDQNEPPPSSNRSGGPGGGNTPRSYYSGGGGYTPRSFHTGITPRAGTPRAGGYTPRSAGNAYSSAGGYTPRDYYSHRSGSNSRRSGSRNSRSYSQSRFPQRPHSAVEGYDRFDGPPLDNRFDNRGPPPETRQPYRPNKHLPDDPDYYADRADEYKYGEFQQEVPAGFPASAEAIQDMRANAHNRNNAYGNPNFPPQDYYNVGGDAGYYDGGGEPGYGYANDDYYSDRMTPRSNGGGGYYSSQRPSSARSSRGGYSHRAPSAPRNSNNVTNYQNPQRPPSASQRPPSASQRPSSASRTRPFSGRRRSSFEEETNFDNRDGGGGFKTNLNHPSQNMNNAKQLRPSSAAVGPSSAVARPGSAAVRPSSAVVRPPSASQITPITGSHSNRANNKPAPVTQKMLNDRAAAANRVGLVSFMQGQAFSGKSTAFLG